ncbi:MAG: hypothetical protein KDA05_03070 [Phycisphaerales bacterium]|nr:hypothetical protein [Phycisphaerales bacterium]
MAGRGGTGVGAVVTISIMGLMVLGLFVTTLVFYTENNKTQTALNDANLALSEYVRESERQNDRVRQYANEARGAAGNKSVVMHLIDSLEAANRLAAGSARVTTDRLNEIAGEVGVGSAQGATASSLVAGIRERDQQIAALNNSLNSANAARTQAQRDLTNERASVTTIRTDFESSMNAANARINGYGDDIRRYLESLRAVESLTQQQVIDLTNDYSAQMARLNSDLAREREQNLILREQLRAATISGQTQGLVPDPATLVDGRVAAINPADREVTIDIGRRQKVVLGMTFTVFGAVTQIRPDASGQYPAGKATVEVIRINDTTATCRVLTERQGNPIVRGDVIANAVYDPAKTFRLVVYGNFDANGDGLNTPPERDDIADLIRSWGAVVDDALAGNVDFLVLGTRPIVPPPPPPGADIAVLSEWQRLDRAARRYDELFNQARETSIPVLNQNRLFYLIGR